MSNFARLGTVTGLSLFSALALAQSPAAPVVPLAPHQVLQGAAARTVVFGDDGGKTEILPRISASATAATPVYHAGPILFRPRIHAIYLGSTWAGHAGTVVRGFLHRSLSEHGASEDFASLSQYGTKTFSAPYTFREDFALPESQVSISDLQIQVYLDRMINEKPMEPPAHDLVYLVFTGPGMQVTLGDSSSDKDFLAYHNDFHQALAHVHYAVIPFASNQNELLASAKVILAKTVVNPDGTAWF